MKFKQDVHKKQINRNKVTSAAAELHGINQVLRFFWL